MSNVRRLVLVDPTDASRQSLKRLLLGLDMVWLEAECSRYEFFSDVVAQTRPDIALVSLDADPEKALGLVAKVAQEVPECNILVVSSNTEGPIILRAMRSGAKEFLPSPVQLEDLVAALGRIRHGRGGKDAEQNAECMVIAVAGATGGVGTTSVAVNLGCELAKHEENNVVLIDLDLTLGDADVCLDIIPDYTLVDVVQNISRLDFALLKRSLTKHSSGLFLLPRPIQMEDAPLIGAEELRRVIGLLKATFTHLVLDVGKSFSPLDIAALEMADSILLVTQLDLPCLRNVVRLMLGFGQREGLADKVRIVVNRIGLDDGQIGIKKAQETIGRDIYWQIPNDYQTMVASRNNGVPLIEYSPRSKLCQAIGGLASELTSGKAETNGARKERRGLLRFLS